MKKVLRAIGGFFAKIGRWIANTAWIQPLLIVGGIFAIIFSIPYIKRGIEGLINANQVDAQLAFYTSSALSLDNAEVGNGESQVDKLFTYLENDNKAKIKEEFGEKFFLSFAKTDCGNCKDLVDGYTTFASKFSSEYRLDKGKDLDKDLPQYKFYTVMTDSIIADSNNKYDGRYRISFIFKNHSEIFSQIVEHYAESKTSATGYEYSLLNYITSGQQAFIDSISSLEKGEDSEIDTPMTLLIDVSEGSSESSINVFGITAIMFNYKTWMDEDADNAVNQSKFLRDCWTYSNKFSEDGETINYYYEDAE